MDTAIDLLDLIEDPPGIQMSSVKSENKKRQKDEITVLRSIYNCNECLLFLKDDTNWCFNIFPNDSKEKKLEVRYMTFDNDGKAKPCNFFIKYLPPIRLIVSIPDNYPSYEPPNFSLVISWLPPWEIAFICQKLDEIWNNDKGNEILFLWIEFLRNDLFDFLKIQESLDVSFLHMIYTFPLDYMKLNWPTFADDRALNHGLFLHPMHFLIKYSTIKHKIEFTRNYHTCSICFDKVSGQKCIEVNDCSHVYCNDCMQTYISTRIDSGLVRSIHCPQYDCTSEINYIIVKEVCPEKFKRYEDLLLKITLNTMTDVVYCPRKACQYPVIKDSEQETLARCTSCGYNFCAYCRKVYHGVTPCAMSSIETIKLIEDYQSGDHHKRRLLQIKYGRKQVQEVVEEHLTKEYLKNSTKCCPHCRTPATKIDGCNKMICIHCQTSFCWLCGDHIDTPNPYDHFVQGGNECYGRLFEGMIEEEMYLWNDLDY